MSRYSIYPDYRPTDVEWLPPIPAHWSVKPIKVVASCNDDTISEATPDDTPIRYVDISSVTYGLGILKSEQMLFGDAPSRARRKTKSGDVIVSTVRTYLKAVAAVDDDHADCIYSTGFAVLRAKRDQIEPGFLKWFTLNDLLIQAVEAHSEGLSYPAINASELISLKTFVPEIEEQSAISTFLDRETARIDALISKKERFIDLLKEKRAADIIDCIRPKPDWKIYPFWSLATLKSISGMVEEGLLSVYLDRGVIPYSEGGGLVHKPSESLEKYQLVEPGDLVMNNQQAWRGSLGVSQYRGIVSPAYLVLELDRNKLNPWFANYLFRARPYVEKFMLASLSVGDIQRQIKWPHLRVIPVSLPSLNEQERLVSKLEAEGARIARLTAQTERSIELLREKRAALITAAVTGKIDVREAA